MIAVYPHGNQDQAAQQEGDPALTLGATAFVLYGLIPIYDLAHKL